jgi:hypothetical protein
MEQDSSPSVDGADPDCQRDELVQAEKALSEAVAGIEGVRAELIRSEHKVEEAIKYVHEAEGHTHHHCPEEPLVVFEDVNESENVEFRTPWATKLTSAWDEAATLLDTPRTPKERLLTPEGTDLAGYLELTLRELQERKIVCVLKFLIVGPTGGA